MGLVGYLMTSDPGRISSITGYDGDRRRRKKIIPLKTSKEMYVIMHVMDCLVHEPGGVVVRVTLKQHEPPNNWKIVGEVKCCPLCWKILWKSPEASHLPDSQPALPVGSTDEYGQLKKVKTTRTKKPRTVDRGHEAYLAITSLANTKTTFSVYDVMEVLKIGRTPSLRHLNNVLHSKKIVKLANITGRGSRTFYKRAP